MRQSLLRPMEDRLISGTRLIDVVGVNVLQLLRYRDLTQVLAEHCHSVQV